MIGTLRGIRLPEVNRRLVMRQLGWFGVIALAVWLSVMPAAATDSQEAWAALAIGGHVALIRHGNAPPGYGGDPPGFRLGECATQRNLDGKGRAQARALGEAFRNHGVRVDRIASSPVCRCVDTASAMAVGQVETSSALLPDVNTKTRGRLSELKEMVANWRGPGTLVLVTHGYTIKSLIGIIPDQAEVVVVRPMPGTDFSAHVVGRIAPPQ
jgi:phosphohistidine phosphatase SixA